VSAYAYGLNPPDFHAHFEAFLGGRWILADPTRLSPQSSFIRIGQGRDAADTSFATIFGNAILTEMQISNELVDTESQPPPYALTGRFLIAQLDNLYQGKEFIVRRGCFSRLAPLNFARVERPSAHRTKAGPVDAPQTGDRLR
jgi:hypothetical protein